MIAVFVCVCVMCLCDVCVCFYDVFVCVCVLFLCVCVCVLPPAFVAAFINVAMHSPSGKVRSNTGICCDRQLGSTQLAPDPMSAKSKNVYVHRAE